MILRNKRFGDQVETDNRTRNLCHLRGISTLDNFFENTTSSARSQSRNNFKNFTRLQRAKKIMSDSPGLVDFAIGPAIFVFNLPDGQVPFFGEIQITEGFLSKRVLGLVEMTCGLVHANCSLPEWQALKLTFFAPARD